MKLKLLFSLLLLTLSHFAFTQHCPFDGVSIIVVDVHERNFAKNIPHLKITMVNVEGKPVLDYKGNEITFWQNLEKSIHSINDLDHAKEMRFPFAKDNYVWVLPKSFQIDGYFLKIENTVKPTKFDKIKLYDVDKYHLCGQYTNEQLSSYSGQRVYQPIEIIID